MTRVVRQSEFGQPMQLMPALEVRFALAEHDGIPPHWHLNELRQMHAQVVECRCGFWVPIGYECPSCRPRQ